MDLIFTYNKPIPIIKNEITANIFIKFSFVESSFNFFIFYFPLL
jgi:hypothetical protein